MKDIHNVATDIQNTYMGTGLSLKVKAYPSTQNNDGTWTVTRWKISMRHPEVTGPAYLVFCQNAPLTYQLGGVKQNNFPDDLFDNITNLFLWEAN